MLLPFRLKQINDYSFLLLLLLLMCFQLTASIIDAVSSILPFVVVQLSGVVLLQLILLLLKSTLQL